MPTTNREIADLKKQIRTLTDRLADLSEDQVDDMSDRAQDYLSQAKDKATEWIETLRDEGYEVSRRAKRVAKNTDDYVHDNPWMVAAGALAVGVVAGFILSRHD